MGDGEVGEGAGGVGEEDGGFWVGELGDGLAAGSAGLAGFVFEIEDEDGAEADARAIGGDGAGDRGLFGAGGEAIGGVFDVAAGEDVGIGAFEEEGGSDVEPGIGSVGVMGGLRGEGTEGRDLVGGEAAEVRTGHGVWRVAGAGAVGKWRRDRLRVSPMTA